MGWDGLIISKDCIKKKEKKTNETSVTIEKLSKCKKVD